MKNKTLFKKVIKKTFPSIYEFRRIQLSRRKFIKFDQKNPGHYYSLAPFDYYRCIFIHIPKTAGISVTHALFGNSAGVHKSVKNYQDIFPSRTFNQYFKFSFVRNPWDRLFSAFNFLKRGGLHNKDAEWAEIHIDKFDTFEQFVHQWVTQENIFKGIHFYPQNWFLTDKNDHIPVDFIGKFESLDQDFRFICHKIGINAKLIHKNASGKKKNFRDFYSTEMKNIVHEVYSTDIEKFKYTFARK